ncbi:predicted protein [Nematostella vectensis]|uniref:Uncharacterized protein n=1 Tax=Nematostella vectensis TaxID=45351 RepID=A7SPR5_NEMVE|nr:transcription termination factor 3, mitochondrial [Nematostella vectensis]EDO34301.1 predicted protein [Nematostella vectensis]|eukprot:XP_001626401.1 predicted protein [Nematostella vectensis]
MAALIKRVRRTILLCRDLFQPFQQREIVLSRVGNGLCNYRFLAGRANQTTNGEQILSALHVEVLSKTPNAFNEKRNISVEHYLSDIGVSLEKVNKQLDISRLSLDRVKGKVGILQGIGLNKEVGSVISARPSILVIKDEVIYSRVKAMRDVGIKPDALMYVVRKSPGILTARTEETLIEKVKFLQGLAVKPKLGREEVLHLLTKCPDIIASCSIASLHDKINFMEKVLRFNHHQLRNILLKQPRVLTFSKEGMKAKYRYCYEEMNASCNSIARCPRLFQCSLKRIKERHLFLRHVGRLKEDMIVDDYGLGVILSPNEKIFAEKIALSSLEEFNDFRHSLSSV